MSDYTTTIGILSKLTEIDIKINGTVVSLYTQSFTLGVPRQMSIWCYYDGSNYKSSGSFMPNGTGAFSISGPIISYGNNGMPIFQGTSIKGENGFTISLPGGLSLLKCKCTGSDISSQVLNGLVIYTGTAHFSFLGMS